MKVTVTKYLNVRVGKADQNAPSYNYLSPGSVIEVEDQPVIGTLYSDSNLWYKGLDGSFYWSGGVSRIGDSRIPKWMNELRMTDIWKKSTGRNIGVAIIDTGITSGYDDLIFDKAAFYTYDPVSGLDDTQGHGTHCAGLIAARNTLGNMVGSAPGCDLFVCKISDSAYIEEADTVRYADAINWCANQEKIQVISISWASIINDAAILKNIQAAVDNAVAKKKIVVCAVGDASKWNDKSVLYPAGCQNVIRIGALPVEGELYPYLGQSLHAVTDGFDIPSFGLKGQLVKMNGTSQSNAIVAGLVALILEKEKFHYSLSSVEQILKNACIGKTFKDGITLPVLDGILLKKYFES